MYPLVRQSPFTGAPACPARDQAMRGDGKQASAFMHIAQLVEVHVDFYECVFSFPEQIRPPLLG